MGFLKKYSLILLVSVVIIRLILVLLPSFKIDMTDWQAWSARIAEVTPFYFYGPNYFADYFPGYLYMLWFLGKSFYILLPHLSIFSIEFEIYLKLFTNLFDLGTAYYIYKIVYRYQYKFALIAPIFYLANPALIFNSSVWGQVDGILTFFLVYSAYCLIELKRAYRFNFFSALSIIVKPQGLAIFPVMIIYLLSNFNFKKYFSLVIIPTLLILLSLPFFSKDPILGLFHLFQKSASTYPYTSMFSYNFWSFAGWWIPDSTKFLDLTFQVWGVVFYLTALIFILLPLIFRRNKDNFFIYFALALTSFAFFLFLTRIHQRYLFPFFSFLLITALIRNSLKIKIIYLALSFIHLINLLYVYYYYNYVYPNPKFSSLLIYKFLSTNYNLFTLLNLFGFGLLVLIYYKAGYTKRNHVQKNS